MRALARALLETAAFLELSEDSVLDPDAAVKAMESIGSVLATASPEERDALSTVAEELATECKAIPGFEAASSFYASFTQSFGL